MKLMMFVTRSARKQLLQNLEIRNYVYSKYKVIIIEDPLFSNDTKNKIWGWVNMNKGLNGHMEFNETTYRKVLYEGMGEPIYDYDLILKHFIGRKWFLMTLSGRPFAEFNASSELDARQQANTYMSTWNSVRIRTDVEYEQEQARN